MINNNGKCHLQERSLSSFLVFFDCKTQTWAAALMKAVVPLMSASDAADERRLQHTAGAWSCIPERWFWHRRDVPFVLRLSSLWRYNSAKTLKEKPPPASLLILFQTRAGLSSDSPLCCGGSVSWSGSADMIRPHVTSGYHQLQCESPASREQR